MYNAEQADASLLPYLEAHDHRIQFVNLLDHVDWSERGINVEP